MPVTGAMGSPADESIEKGGSEEEQMVEELFVACRFDEASKRASALLLHEEQQESKEDQGKGDPAQTGHNPPSVDIGSSCSVRLDVACTRGDRLAAILLQCAHELKRQDEEAAFCRYYAHRRPMPFPVATIWLQLWIARGDFGGARLVLENLLTKLRHALSSAHKSGALMEMHSQVAGMLVERTLLPLGEYEAAKDLVSTDPHLDDVHRQHLLACCQAGERSAKPASLGRVTRDCTAGSYGHLRSRSPYSEDGGKLYHRSNGRGLLSPSRSSSSSYLASLLLGAPSTVRECLYPSTQPSSSSTTAALTRALQRGELRRLLMSLLSVAAVVIGFHFRRGLRDRGRQAFGLVARALKALLLGDL